MIISHKYKYIFLKTTKTAGTSIEISLSRFCGEDDIITKISAKDEAIRQQFGVGPQNCEYTRRLNWTEFSLGDWQQLITTGKQPQIRTKFWNHMPASKIKRAVGDKIWRDYYKFCFVRNPWDRAISRYYWNIEKTGEQVSLDQSLEENNPNSNFNIYTMKGKLAVDFVGKYENLLEDLNTVCQKLDIPFDNWLPKAKSGARKDRRPYQEILSPQQAEYIRSKCEQEINFFNYQY